MSENAGRGHFQGQTKVSRPVWFGRHSSKEEKKKRQCHPYRLDGIGEAGALGGEKDYLLPFQANGQPSRIGMKSFFNRKEERANGCFFLPLPHSHGQVSGGKIKSYFAQTKVSRPFWYEP